MALRPLGVVRGYLKRVGVLATALALAFDMMAYEGFGFTPPTWASASLCSFAVAALLALVVGRARRR